MTGTASPVVSSHLQMSSNTPVAVQSLMGTSALMVSTSWMELAAGSSTTKWLPP